MYLNSYCYITKLLHSHTINTYSYEFESNCKHNFKGNLISLLYGLSTSVTNILHQSFFKMATFGLQTVPKSLWPPMYRIKQCLLWEISHCFHQGALQDFDIGVPVLTVHAFNHCPFLGVHWADVRAAEGPINPESP